MKSIILKKCFFKSFLIVMLILTSGASFADFSINFGVKSRESKACNHCNYRFNDENASFCSNCGKTFQEPLSAFYRCPRCRFPFVLTEDNSFTKCDCCNHLNMITNRFCSSCGAKIVVRRIVTECPQCFLQFEGSCPYTENRKKYCGRCGNYYYANIRRCPYCQYYHGKKRKIRCDTTSYSPSSSYKTKYHTKKHTYHKRSTLISSFNKQDYSKSVKRISIAAICSQQSFSKVVVNVKKTGKYAPIINMIKVKYNNRYFEYAQGVRLHEGRNQFVVAVPENSSQLVLSFDHGKGALVNIYLE